MQGILVFASVMATLGLQIILESVRTLLSNVSKCPFLNSDCFVPLIYYVIYCLKNIKMTWHHLCWFTSSDEIISSRIVTF